jgi:predicted dehydrogenase
LEYELAEFANSILQGRPPLVRAEEGLLALKTANQVLEQIQWPKRQ